MSPAAPTPHAAHPTVVRALSYPFGPPEHAYVFVAGEQRPFDPRRDAEVLRGRRPVLAVGSNAAPKRLAEKFGPTLTGPDAVTPVTTAVAEGHVVAHSAKFAGYASIPATLHPWAGARAQVHATWLTRTQLAIMDETETLGVAYDRVEIAAALCPAGAAVSVDIVVEAYVSRAGAFGVDGRPAVSAAARVTGARDLPILDQTAIQIKAMTLLTGDDDVHAFVAANAANAELRTTRSAQLSALVGLPFVPPGS